MNRLVIFLALFWAISGTTAQAMRCKVATGAYGLPTQTDIEALASILVGGVDNFNTCLGGGCNFDGLGGTNPTVGDVAFLLGVLQSGSEPGLLCQNTNSARVFGQFLVQTPRMSQRQASTEESLTTRIRLLREKSAQLALALAPSFQEGPFVEMTRPTPPDPEKICDLENVVPGELIFRLQNRGILTRIKEIAEDFGFSLKEQAFPPRFTLKLPSPEGLDIFEDTEVANALKESAKRACHLIRKLPGLLHVQPNVIRRASAKPTDPLYNTHQWNMTMIDLPKARSQTLGNVTVGVIDTGILATHPDLATNLVPGYDFVTSISLGQDGDGRDNNPDDTSAGFHSLASHGTHVTGIIGAKSDNAQFIAGVCPRCKLLPLRALGGSGLALGSIADEVDAILWGAGLTVSGVPANQNPTKIINLSLGGQEPCTPEEIAALSQTDPLGVVLVAAAGNFNSQQVDAPANCPGAIAVGSLTPGKLKASYSTRDVNLEANLLMAPGGASSNNTTQTITSTTYISPFHGVMNGTSQATPHVAGVIALMRSVNPSLTGAQVFNLLVQTAEDLGPPGRDGEYGYGMVNAYKAVLAAMGKAEPAPAPVADVSSLSFTGSTTTKSFLVQHIVQDDISAGALTTSHSWVTATVEKINSLVDGQMVPTLKVDVTINHTGLLLGTSESKVHLVTSVGNISIPITVVIPPRFRLIVMDLGGQISETENINSQSFSFGGLPTNTPIVLKGEQDLDGDGTYCENGEPCGFYNSAAFAASINQASPLTLTPDQTLGGLVIRLQAQ